MSMKNADYVSMTQPHAAGSLLSSVDDLARWDESLTTLDLLTRSSYERMTTRYVLKNGERTAAVLVAKIGSIDRFPTASHLTSYFGVFPEEKSSGVDREGNPLSSGAMRMMNGGSSRSVTGTQVAVINDGVWIPFRRASSKKITDGTSKTYLVGEKAMDTLRYTTPRGTKKPLHGRRLQESVNARLMGRADIRTFLTLDPRGIRAG